ncbi:DUF5110 domain-containing protein [Streptomyces sviceus]|uniref:DUF5110 domain-containing protein n=1 Tax=Streptomyces sviceus TaxID=285530 RepID=UPI0036F08277
MTLAGTLEAAEAAALYEDEGDGWDYEQGAGTRTELRWDEADGTLTVGRPVGDYLGRPARRVVRARLVEPGRGWADASALWLTAGQQQCQGLWVRTAQGSVVTSLSLRRHGTM